MLLLLYINYSVRLCVELLSLLAEYFLTNVFMLRKSDLVEGAAAMGTLNKAVVSTAATEHGWLLRWATHGTATEAASATSATESWIHFPEAVAATAAHGAATLIGPYGAAIFLFLITS